MNGMPFANKVMAGTLTDGGSLTIAAFEC